MPHLPTPTNALCCSIDSEQRALLQLLRQDGMDVDEDAEVMPLTGGVSSQIHLVRDRNRVFVVKSALGKLKVAEDWRADPGRNRSEQRYLRYVGSFLPRAVPGILFAPEDRAYFCMEYFGEGYTNWKTALLNGDCEPRWAREAMSLLAQIHSASRGRPDLAREFATAENFHQLRIDPYILTTARRHPALAPILEEEATRIERTSECLVHGDFSPKNILVSASRLIFLDCEAAWYGDPAFDVAFFLNHLCLKALYHAPREPGLRALFEAARDAYFVTGRRVAEDLVDRRSARLLLILMLARVDGKSPVEYLDDRKKEFVREFVSRVLPRFQGNLSEISSLWFGRLKQYFGSL